MCRVLKLAAIYINVYICEHSKKETSQEKTSDDFKS